MVFSLFLVVVAGGLSLAIAALLLSQGTPNQNLRKNVRTIHAAEAGMDVALSQIRAARISSLDPAGDYSKLPCYPDPVSGYVGADDDDLNYAVTVRYYETNPQGETESWRSDNDIACDPAGGTVSLPKFALVSSEGMGDDVPGSSENQGDRSLESVYKFSVTTSNVSGGLVPLNNPDYANLCMAAETITVGSRILMNPCSETNVKQIWAYREDLTVALVATLDATPLCMDATNGQAADVFLKVCGRVTGDPTVEPNAGDPNDGEGDLDTDTDDDDDDAVAPGIALDMRQQWSFNNTGQWQSRQESGELNSYCIRTYANLPVAGTHLITTSGKCEVLNNTVTNYSKFNPSPEAGAGAAGSQDGTLSANGQLVSYKEYGRCFDVPADIMDEDQIRYVYLYTCKQAPDPADVRFNQKLKYGKVVRERDGNIPPGVTDFSLWTDGNRIEPPTYNKPPKTLCLSAGPKPDNSVGDASAGTLLAMRTCNAASKRQQWEFKGNAGANYGDNYTVELKNHPEPGMCLTVGGQNVSGVNYKSNNHKKFSLLVVKACDGTPGQKWNAPPKIDDSAQEDTNETTSR